MEFINYIPGILIVLVLIIFVSIIWINKIGHTIKNHFECDGDDFLDENDKNQIG